MSKFPPQFKKQDQSKKQGLFLDLCYDQAFKTYFKSNSYVLRSFLKHFLPLPKGRKIEKVKNIDPFIEPETERGKQAILDLKVQLDNKEWVNVEMQIVKPQGFKRRILYYLAKIFVGPLLKGEEYKELYPAYSLVFTAFDMFKDQKDYIHSFSMRSNKPPFFRFSPDLNVTVVELSKFLSKKPDTLVDMPDLWCYLLKESGDMDMKRAGALAKKGEEMKQATDHLIQLSKDEKLKLYREAQTKQKWDRLARDELVREEGMEKGKKEGMQEGIQQGMEKLVLNMLKEGTEISFISKVSGWTIDRILKLKDKN